MGMLVSPDFVRAPQVLARTSQRCSVGNVRLVARVPLAEVYVGRLRIKFQTIAFTALLLPVAVIISFCCARFPGRVGCRLCRAYRCRLRLAGTRGITLRA